MWQPITCPWDVKNNPETYLYVDWMLINTMRHSELFKTPFCIFYSFKYLLSPLYQLWHPTTCPWDVKNIPETHLYVDWMLINTMRHRELFKTPCCIFYSFKYLLSPLYQLWQPITCPWDVKNNPETHLYVDWMLINTMRHRELFEIYCWIFYWLKYLLSPLYQLWHPTTCPWDIRNTPETHLYVDWMLNHTMRHRELFEPPPWILYWLKCSFSILYNNGTEPWVPGTSQSLLGLKYIYIQLWKKIWGSGCNGCHSEAISRSQGVDILCVVPWSSLTPLASMIHISRIRGFWP
jgi:hypothetical protein